MPPASRLSTSSPLPMDAPPARPSAEFSSVHGTVAAVPWATDMTIPHCAAYCCVWLVDQASPAPDPPARHMPWQRERRCAVLSKVCLWRGPSPAPQAHSSSFATRASRIAVRSDTSRLCEDKDDTNYLI